MKICILSMQRVLNYGSLLQAYSLKKILGRMGHDVSFIDIEPNESDNKLLEKTKTFEEGLQSESKGIIYRFMQQDSCPFFALAKIINKKKVERLQLDFADKMLKLNDHSQSEYDVCVIGSDEVFNFSNNTDWGFTSQLFGNVSQAKKVITYAASCGFSRVEDLTNEVKKVIQNSFKRIEAFSVRDCNTEAFVKELTGIDPVMSLDPVLVGDFDDEIAAVDGKFKLPQRYCIVYAYHGRIDSKEEIDEIVSFCKKNNMTLVSIGGYQKWIHNHLPLSPFEVLAAFKNAAFVVTDTFHGTIFSAKYSSRFAVIVRDSNRNKLVDLVNKLGLQNHVLEGDKTLDVIFKEKNNFDRINEVLKMENKKTVEYLEKAL